MTDRKPAGLSFTSWIDQQIAEAQERGAFDNLPGAGKPIPRSAEPFDGQTWLRDYVRREGVPTSEVLPTPLKLRKEIELLEQTVPSLRSESEVREVVADLNLRISQWRRIPLGPPVFVPLVDEEKMVESWRSAQPTVQPATLPAAEPTSPRGDARRQPGGVGPSQTRRWRRVSRRLRHLRG